MSRNRWALAALTAAAVAAGGTVLTAGQLPLAPAARSGEGVTPVCLSLMYLCPFSEGLVE